MADLEKVLKWLKHCRNNAKCNDCESCEYGGYSMVVCENLIDDVLELLKDQAKRIETLEKINAIDLNPKWPYVFNNYRKVVLCKDCKHYQPDEYDPGKGDCMGPCDNMVKVSDNWFCADGEKKYVRY